MPIIEPADRDREMAVAWMRNNDAPFVDPVSLARLIAHAREEGWRELRPITDAMIEAAAGAAWAKMSTWPSTWDKLHPLKQNQMRDIARAALEAAAIKSL